jgi:hypothetical protein
MNDSTRYFAVAFGFLIFAYVAFEAGEPWVYSAAIAVTGTLLFGCAGIVFMIDERYGVLE